MFNTSNKCSAKNYQEVIYRNYFLSLASKFFVCKPEKLMSNGKPIENG